jgi:hypothetical protein
MSAVAAGFVLEDMGARIEAKIWDPLIERDTKCQHDDWYGFLCYAPLTEPVGHRYLRTLTLRLKFELAFGIALVSLWFGSLWLDSLELLWRHNSVVLFSSITLASASYLLWESEETARALSDVRHLLLHGKKCPMAGKPAEIPSHANIFDVAIAVTAVVCVGWGVWHSMWVLSGHGDIGHNSGLTTGLIFLLFGVAFGALWRWLRRDNSSSGRRRGMAVRCAIAFTLLAVFAVIRRVFEPHLSGSEAIVIAGLGSIIYLLFAFSSFLRNTEPKSVS